MVKKWIEKNGVKTESEYEEAKRQFEMAMGKPFIALKLEIPDGFETYAADFRKLETNPEFHQEVKDLIKKRLLLDSRRKNMSSE
ncbi:MAG: hypothetical protein P8X87_02460 [Candidatus Bathyarchaeota archaeon]